jgi:hypothetical protein
MVRKNLSLWLDRAMHRSPIEEERIHPVLRGFKSHFLLSRSRLAIDRASLGGIIPPSYSLS